MGCFYSSEICNSESKQSEWFWPRGQIDSSNNSSSEYDSIHSDDDDIIDAEQFIGVDSSQARRQLIYHK